MAATRSPRGPRLRAALGAACGLLGLTATPARATELDAAMLLYAEVGRVSAVETVAALQHDFGGGRIGNLKLVLDGLTGASANGAVPWREAQTFTRPSGQTGYRTAPGETPLDNTFRDTRAALSASYSFPLDRLTTLSAGLYGSGERDYASLGAHAGLARDLFHRNTTLSVTLQASHDRVFPQGGRPVPFAAMTDPGTPPPRLDGDGTKDVTDLVLGWTQVVDRRTIAQLSYTRSTASGYLTDPYKILSVVDGATGAPVDNLYERRPPDRSRHSLFARIKHHLRRDVVDLSYRYYSDDWDIRSHTAEVRYRWFTAPARYFEPHVRWYHQTAAGFYRRYLVAGEPLPESASADYRLGDLTTWTAGIKYGRALAEDTDFSLRLEYYVQSGQAPANPAGALADQDLFPSVRALFAQVAFRYRY